PLSSPLPAPLPAPLSAGRTAPVAADDKPVAGHAPTPAARPQTPSGALPLAPEHWADILVELALTGVTQSIAANCELVSVHEGLCQLALKAQHAALWNKTHEERIAVALASRYGMPVKLALTVGDTNNETPAEVAQRRRDERLAAALLAIDNDARLQELLDSFDATLDRDTIKPRNQSGD
ncbi:MAG: hypothetical protein NWR26_10740, partial [Pseudomonadales bacterium]|nr:hypothetical protein [Pseudomonadales bacterium]